MANLDAHINPASGVWDDNYYAQHQNGAGADPNVDKYYNQLLQAAQNQKDLALKQLDAQHKLALGNNDPQTAQFLESVANKFEADNGRIPYDYQRYSNKELEDYANGNQAIAQNKDLALNRLAADEQNQQQALGIQQGNQNQSTIEGLNQRGLLYGQAPTGGLQQGASLGGMQGVAGQAGNLQNADFANKGQDIANNYNFGVTGALNQAGQDTRTLNTSHDFNMGQIATDARRGVQDTQNNFQFGNTGANNAFQASSNEINSARQTAQVNAANYNMDALRRKQQIYGG